MLSAYKNSYRNSKKILKIFGGCWQFNLVRETLSNAREILNNSMITIFFRLPKQSMNLEWTCRHQTQRNNVPSVEMSEYFHKSDSVPFLNHLLTVLNRFSTLHERDVTSVRLVPSEMSLKPKWKILSFFRRC